MPVQKLSASSLYHTCDPSKFRFKTTSDLEELPGVIGQPRAIEAVKFGMGIRREGYNLFALGPAGTGKYSLVERYANEQARGESPPSDWCYVNNFRDPRQPTTLKLPTGMGTTLAADMDHLINDLHTALPAVFESEEYQSRSNEIEEQFKQRQEQAIKEIQESAERKHLTLIRTPGGFTLAPERDGEIMMPDEFEKLSEDERTRIKADTEALQQELQQALDQTPKWQKQAQDQMGELNRELAAHAIAHLIDLMREKYKALENVVGYLNQVEEDVIKNFRYFLRGDGKKRTLSMFGIEMPSQNGPQEDARYRVNAFVTHPDHDGAPVIYEDQPGYNNLIGRVEHRAEFGALVTDFTMIRPGALHRANGGYLILDALKVLMQPYAWEGLKRVLRAGEIRIESLAELTSLISTTSLQPEPIPLDVKVILLGERRIYYLLSYLDPEFDELFKVAMDFDDRMERDEDNDLLYARMITTLVHKEKLRHFDVAAVARIIEHGSRYSENRDKLSTHMRSLLDLLSEADYWATQQHHDTVTASDVQQAIDASVYRLDLIRERIQEEINNGTLMIDTEGEVCGQVNGLSVIDLGKFRFGRPSRITARVRLGKKEVVDIEREVKLGGPIHSKGVFILSAFLSARYLKDRPPSMSASLVFEQSYGGIEGDSASSAELYTLLSALADVPVRQSLAVTGSVNQQGQIQPIGGVNEKIEGFFDICAQRGLNGKQGVIIPASNCRHLMLREDVRKAVDAGQFHVYAIDHVDDGIELLTGLPAGQRDEQGVFTEGSINRMVEDRLKYFSDTLLKLAASEKISALAGKLKNQDNGSED